VTLFLSSVIFSPMSRKTLENLLTVAEAADRLKVRPVTLYAWVKARRIPHLVLSVGQRKETIRFSEEALTEWLEARGREAKGFTKWDKR
jgi:excisionase family DNA binding protein